MRLPSCRPPLPSACYASQAWLHSITLINSFVSRGSPVYSEFNAGVQKAPGTSVAQEHLATCPGPVVGRSGVLNDISHNRTRWIVSPLLDAPPFCKRWLARQRVQCRRQEVFRCHVTCDATQVIEVVILCRRTRQLGAGWQPRMTAVQARSWQQLQSRHCPARWTLPTRCARANSPQVLFWCVGADHCSHAHDGGRFIPPRCAVVAGAAAAIVRSSRPLQDEVQDALPPGPGLELHS
jgi:hypothetical protein